ncbi:MAG: hypothetical protein M0P40_06120 [Bacteroidales bacterium]|nr:hypothetical protein [Bacteroidales bacterium]MDD2264890.1 hypothetical protein [Bacteroidales bacterium]MDY0354016.1 hypothetical protein [Bacteroidales bacterium]
MNRTVMIAHASRIMRAEIKRKLEIQFRRYGNNNPKPKPALMTSVAVNHTSI